MNRFAFVSALLVAMCGSIMADELQDCIKTFESSVEAIKVPAEIERIANIVRAYEPGKSLSDIISNYEIDTSVFVKSEAEADALKKLALEFSSELFEPLSTSLCIHEEEFQKYLSQSQGHMSAGNQKMTDYLDLCAEIQNLDYEVDDDDDE